MTTPTSNRPGRAQPRRSRRCARPWLAAPTIIAMALLLVPAAGAAPTAAGAPSLPEAASSVAASDQPPSQETVADIAVEFAPDATRATISSTAGRLRYALVDCDGVEHPAREVSGPGGAGPVDIGPYPAGIATLSVTSQGTTRTEGRPCRGERGTRATDAVPAGSLPFTGGDLWVAAGLGILLVATGMGLIFWGRPSRAPRAGASTDPS